MKSAVGGRHAVVTIGRRARSEDRGRAVAHRWGLPFYPRAGRSVSAVRIHAEADGVIRPAVVVVEDDDIGLHLDPTDDPVSHKRENIFRFHPGMGLNRLRRVMRGEKDWMIESMGLRPGDHLLDATLGLGSDMLLGSYVVGPRGLAVGIESQKLIAMIVSEGMQAYRHKIKAVEQALRRIRVKVADYRQLLPQLPSDSFDVVYFDPMFEVPVEESQHMVPIRHLAADTQLDRDTLHHALTVARRRVVVKDRRDGPYVRSNWFAEVIGGRRSRIVYCIARVG